MKINPYIQVQQVYGTNKATATKKTTQTSRKDGVEISGFGKELQAAKQALADTPDIRTDITAPIKSKIDNGTYDVSAESFADKLMRIADEMR